MINALVQPPHPYDSNFRRRGICRNGVNVDAFLPSILAPGDGSILGSTSIQERSNKFVEAQQIKFALPQSAVLGGMSVERHEGLAQVDEVQETQRGKGSNRNKRSCIIPTSQSSCPSAESTYEASQNYVHRTFST